jgi:hypothetical protein
MLRNRALISYFYGRKPPPSKMFLWMSESWVKAITSNVKICPLNEGFFSFFFENMEGRKAVLKRGPRLFGDVVLVLLPWNEHFNSSRAQRDQQILLG